MDDEILEALQTANGIDAPETPDLTPRQRGHYEGVAAVVAVLAASGYNGSISMSCWLQSPQGQAAIQRTTPELGVNPHPVSWADLSATGEIYVYVKGQLILKIWPNGTLALFQVAPSQTLRPKRAPQLYSKITI
jgi:hypothetical protein